MGCWWDVDGAAFAGSEQAFKEFGELVTKQRSGALVAIDANRINAAARFFSTAMESVGASVNAINVRSLTPDELKLKTLVNSLVQQSQKLVQGTGLLMDINALGIAFPGRGVGL